MKRSKGTKIFPVLSFILFVLILCPVASAQGIRYVTREALKSPAPGLIPLPGAVAWNQIPAVNPFFQTGNQTQIQQGAPALVGRPARPAGPAGSKRNPTAGSAEYALALYYFKGSRTVRRNLQASKYWLTIAARKGNSDAQKVLRQWAAAAK